MFSDFKFKRKILKLGQVGWLQTCHLNIPEIGAGDRALRLLAEIVVPKK